MKSNIFRIALLTLPILALNVLFFLISGAEHPASVWIAYAAIHIAWAIALATPALFNREDHPVNTILLGTLSTVFFAVQFVVGIILMLIAPSSHVWVLVLEVVLFVVALIALLVTAWSNSSFAGEEKERLANRQVGQQHALRVKLILAKCQDTELRQQLRRTYDQLMRTPMKNTPAVEQLNYDIDGVLNKLERVAAMPEEATPLAQQLQQLVEQREQVLKFTH